MQVDEQRMSEEVGRIIVVASEGGECTSLDAISRVVYVSVAISSGRVILPAGPRVHCRDMLVAELSYE